MRGSARALGTRLLFVDDKAGSGAVSSEAVFRVVCGKVRPSSTCGTSGYSIVSPDIVRPAEDAAEVLAVEPVYPLTKGLTQKRLRAAISSALSTASPLLSSTPSTLSPSLLLSLSWPRPSSTPSSSLTLP